MNWTFWFGPSVGGCQSPVGGCGPVGGCQSPVSGHKPLSVVVSHTTMVCL